MSPGFRHIEKGVLERYRSSILVRTYATGEKRIEKDPPPELVEGAFEERGTYAGVAAAFGVSRSVIERWTKKYSMNMVSQPERALANLMRRRFKNQCDVVTVAQWVMDEGSISVAYFNRGDYTILLVCGSMNDTAALSRIATILDAAISSSKSPGPTTLPLRTIRVQSARAYALLEVLKPDLVGLKAMEADAALEFFPPSGRLSGKHTTDEFLSGVWRDHALKSIRDWNSSRMVKLTPAEIEKLARDWFEGRVRRARRFVRPAGEH